MEIAIVNEDGLRGTVAARDYEEGEIIAAVPYNCSVELVHGKSAVTGPVCYCACPKYCSKMYLVKALPIALALAYQHMLSSCVP